MFKNLHKVIVAVAVFAMTIGSGFAMEINPPTEPVKAIVETEAVEEAPQQVLMGYGYYNHITGDCVFLGPLPEPEDCSVMNFGPKCTIEIDEVFYDLYLVSRTSTSNPWTCILLLRKPL